MIGSCFAFDNSKNTHLIKIYFWTNFPQCKMATIRRINEWPWSTLPAIPNEVGKRCFFPFSRLCPCQVAKSTFVAMHAYSFRFLYLLLLVRPALVISFVASTIQEMLVHNVHARLAIVTLMCERNWRVRRTRCSTYVEYWCAKKNIFEEYMHDVT